MSTPIKSNNGSDGAAAPAGESSEIGSAMMGDVAKKLGIRVAIPADTGDGEGEQAGGGEDGAAAEETEEQKAERLANETDEDREAREAEEAAAAGGDDDAAGAGEETEEQKAERLANETDEDREAREAEEAAAAEEEGKDDPAKAEKIAAAKEVTLKLKDLAPDVRKRVQGVIDGLVTNIVTKERAETTRLGGRVEELTAELETVQKAKGPTIVGSVNPVFMADDVTLIDEREEQIEQFETWAEGKLRKGGDNLPDSEGYDPNKPTHTAEAIEQRLAELRREKKKILPAARANLQKRAQIETGLRKIYPAIFDPKTAEYAQVQQVVKALPELKQFADYRVIALKQILGDRALAELLKKQKESSPQSRNKPGAKPNKTPPRAPGGGSPAKGGALPQRGGKPAANQAVEKFAKDPTRKALASVALDMMTEA